MKSVVICHRCDDAGGVQRGHDPGRVEQQSLQFFMPSRFTEMMAEPGPQVRLLFARQPRRVIALEACAGSHSWGRVFQDLGHSVRLLPAREVKPFVRLPKTDASDAAAIAEAARRPELRSVPVKTETEQAACSAHRARDQLVRQRTAFINALRAHLAEFGIVAPAGAAGRARLFEQLRGPELEELPELLGVAAQGLLEAIEALERSIATIEAALAAAADATAKRLQEVPGIGPLTASALVAFAGDAGRFKSARHFVAWLGLAPRSVMVPEGGAAACAACTDAARMG